MYRCCPRCSCRFGAGPRASTCPQIQLREQARAGPDDDEEEEKSSATRFELGGPKGALRFDEATPSPGGRATAAARGTAAGGTASAPGSTLGGSDGNDGASAAVAWPAVTAARLALRRWREGPGWCCSGGSGRKLRPEPADEAAEQAEPGLRVSRFVARCFFGAFVAAVAATGWRHSCHCLQEVSWPWMLGTCLRGEASTLYAVDRGRLWYIAFWSAQ